MSPATLSPHAPHTPGHPAVPFRVRGTAEATAAAVVRLDRLGWRFAGPPVQEGDDVWVLWRCDCAECRHR